MLTASTRLTRPINGAVVGGTTLVETVAATVSPCTRPLLDKGFRTNVIVLYATARNRVSIFDRLDVDVK